MLTIKSEKNLIYHKEEKTHQRTVIIYSDYGTSPASVSATKNELFRVFENKYQIILADKEYVNDYEWEIKTELFVMPGGFTKPHYKNLSSAGNMKIKRFVEGGGKYLGICAGGYYGCSKTEFDANHPLEILLNGPLDFYPGKAIGPAYGPNTYTYNSGKGMRAALISCSGDIDRKSTKIYFNGGCFFDESTIDSETENIRILSRYLDLPNTPPAIISCQVGLGIAVLSGVHFEISPKHIGKEKDTDLSVLAVLENHENQREKFFDFIINQMNISS